MPLLEPEAKDSCCMTGQPEVAPKRVIFASPTTRKRRGRNCRVNQSRAASRIVGSPSPRSTGCEVALVNLPSHRRRYLSTYTESMRPVLYLFLFTFCALSAQAQESLRQQIRAIAIESHGKVSVACSLPGSALNCDLNPNAQPPMQSVFKLPLAIVVLHQVEQGTLSLDQPVRFLPEDRILPHVYSPLQKQYPDAGVDVPLRELLRLAVSLSDNVAADILLRLMGGPKVVDTYIAALGVRGFHLQDSEAVLHREMSAQYRNWFEPEGAVQLLQDQRQFAAYAGTYRSAYNLDDAVKPNRSSGRRSAE